MDGGFHGLPHLCQKIPYLRAFTLLHVFPVAASGVFAPVQNLAHGIHVVNIVGGCAVVSFFGQCTTSYTEYGPFIQLFLLCIESLESHSVRVGALGKSAGKTMEEASEILYEALEKIMEDDLSADDGDFDAGELGIAGAAAAEQVQQMAAAMQGHVAQMQAAMQEALAKGDMAEYMRLAQEFQQKMMEQALGQQK